MTTQEIIDGERAKQLLQDELLNRALDDIELQYVDAWKKTGISDTDERERLWHAFRAVEAFRTHLRVTVDGGTVAAVLSERKGRPGMS